mgnify:FL=1
MKLEEIIQRGKRFVSTSYRGLVLGLGLFSLAAVGYYNNQKEVPKADYSEKIVYASKEDGDWDIYMINPDGSNKVNLTNNDADDWFPIWSPNGRPVSPPQ